MKEKKGIEEKGTSMSANSLIWSGAGVSIAEILTGIYLTPLGLRKGLAAAVLGHVIGCALLFTIGLIGGYTRHSSMETTKMSSGQKGGLLFCGLNVLQLVDWISIMIYDDGLVTNGIFNTGLWVWCLVIGGPVLVRPLVGIRDLGEINTAAMAAPLVLTLILCRVIFTNSGEPSMEADSSLGFGTAVELSVTMSLSWLSLISSYTRKAEKPFRTTAASALIYGPVSCFIYVIGMGATIRTGEYGISVIMVKAELGAAGFLIITLSTVTITFLDAYSAGVSSVPITHRIKGKWATVAVTLTDTAAAMVYPVDNITDFLYLISSVFAPMIAIQVADYFIIRQDREAEEANLPNLLIWLAGFVVYRILIRVDTPVGSTLPDITAIVVLCVVCHQVVFTCCTLLGRENATKA